MSEETLVAFERRGPVAWVWLERPEVHNAFNDVLVAQLEAALGNAIESDARAIVLAGRGRSFSAGADLNWMKSAGQTSDEENVADAARLASMLRRLASAPQATIARVQGAALGGGLGLVAACDLAITVERATFGFSEVKLGLIPAVISPHVIRKIGPGRAQALFVTGERFKGQAAFRHGLVSEVVATDAALDEALHETLGQVLANAPQAVTKAKQLVAEVTRLQAAGDLSAVDDYTSRAIAACRASEEAACGIAAFLDKRAPSWKLAPETEA
ncbi:MAG: enoyl-CoA hydratase/isomerase family protein [Planctomycetes bacterium]|nr:enoyl-CoA hydratase/isomerase family protein [Planctomycetota bacterium]